MFAGVQPQAVVHLSPHPTRAVSPFQDDIGDVPCGQLLRYRQTARPSTHNHYVETFNRQFVQTASLASGISQGLLGKP